MNKWLALTRIGLGWIFLWAFLDKVWGLGFTTTAEAAWLNGGSPTMGFLKFGTHGPFSSLYQAMAGSPIVDWLFMLGLFGLGIAFLLGVALRFAGRLGALLMLLLYFAAVPPEHNPVLDEHIIYALLMLGLGALDAGNTWGFGRWWWMRVGQYHRWLA